MAEYIDEDDNDDNDADIVSNVLTLKLNRPHKKQQEIIDAYARYRFIVVKAGRRFGKSLISQQITITECLKYSNFSSVIITPTFSLSKKFYSNILRLIPASFIQEQNKSELLIVFKNGSKIQFYSGESLINLRGTAHHLIVIDEAAYSIVEDEWNNIIRPTLTDYEGKAIFISTPRGKNFFIKLYQKQELNSNWKSFHFTSYDNPHVLESEIDEAKKDLPQIDFEQEYLALETANRSNPFKNNIDKNISNISSLQTCVFGIDVAKSFDYCVIYGISKCGKCTYLKKFQSHSYTIIQERIKDVRNQFDGVAMYIDITGVGVGIYDNIVYDKQGNIVIENIHKFLFTQQSKIRIFNELIKDVEDSNVTYTQQTADELSTIEMNYSNNGYPKFGAQSGFHDDIVCAFAIANSFRKKQNYYEDWNVETL